MKLCRRAQLPAIDRKAFNIWIGGGTAGELWCFYFENIVLEEPVTQSVNDFRP